MAGRMIGAGERVKRCNSCLWSSTHACCHSERYSAKNLHSREAQLSCGDPSRVRCSEKGCRNCHHEFLTCLRHTREGGKPVALSVLAKGLASGTMRRCFAS